MNGSRPVSSQASSDALDIWQFSADISDRLILWNSINIVFGLLISRRTGFLRGVGSQHIGWGLINIGIAIFGKRASRRRFARLSDPYAAEVQAADTRNLRLLLAANGLLDVVYVLGGLGLLKRARRKSLRGAGLGIIFQGAFLFIFDWRMFRRSFYLRARNPKALLKMMTIHAAV